MVNLYDTHFHLDLFESREEIIKEIEENQIYTIAVTNLPVLFTKLKDSLSSKYIKPALGFHPELLVQYSHHIPQMWPLLTETRYIGEVGLDFKTSKASKELQISFFTELIKRCNILGDKILTVHSRQSASEVVSIIGANFTGKAILHWYSGDKPTLLRAIENGYYFSINYSMVNSKSGKELIRLIPLDRLLLETDAPFVKINNKPFTPVQVISIVNELAVIFNLEQKEMTSILWSNFKSMIK
ncbi:MAG: Qat anti-phage system TatD family nuclease QatD [Bacteroidota bacterium]